MSISGSQIRAARAKVWESSKFTYLISYLIPPGSRPLFWHWYSYLRWVDDLVDEDLLNPSERDQFLERQFNLLDEGPSCDPLSLSLEEHLLTILISHDLPKRPLRKYIGSMLSCIKFDAERAGKPYPFQQLHENREREAEAYLSAVAYFSGLQFSTAPPGSEAAAGAKIAHVLRDLAKDLRNSNVNISVEEISAYGLNLSAPNAVKTEQVINWVAASVRIAERLLYDGRQAIRSCRHVRYKILVLILIAKYKTHLQGLRANGFVADASPRMPVSSFLKNVAVLLIGAFVPRPFEVASNNDFAPIVTLSYWSRLLLLCRIAPLANRRGLQDLQEVLLPVSQLISDHRRKRRRFRGAYLLGHSACSAIAPTTFRDKEVGHSAGLIVAYWGLSAIEMDRLQDEKLMSQAAILDLSKQWIEAIRAATECDRPQPSFEIDVTSVDCIFLLMTNRLLELVRHFCVVSVDKDFPIYSRAAQEAFCDKATFLMQGQMTSMSQAELHAPKDWAWYYRKIMNHKNVEFLLTPFRLYCVEAGSSERFEQLASSFLSLNAAYVHYQLLDDLADASEDMSCGIIGAPGFVLLSQGSLGKMYLDLCEGRSGQLGRFESSRVKQAIFDSDLLCPELVKSPAFDLYRHLLENRDSDPSSTEQVEILLKCAIANVEAELNAPLLHIAKKRFRESLWYLEAMRCGDASGARKILLDSNVPNRFLSGVGEDGAITNLSNQLATIEDDGRLAILYTMERMMRRTFRAAAKEWVV